MPKTEIEKQELEACWSCGHKMFVGKHTYCDGKYIVRCGSDGKDCLWFPSSGAINKADIPAYITAWNTRSGTARRFPTYDDDRSKTIDIERKLTAAEKDYKNKLADMEATGGLILEAAERRAETAEKKLTTWQAVTDANAGFVVQIKELESKVRACENSVTGYGNMAIEDENRIEKLEGALEKIKVAKQSLCGTGASVARWRTCENMRKIATKALKG